ncbi:MAG: gamma-glutamyltransferase [Chloroflexota bacterium]
MAGSVDAASGADVARDPHAGAMRPAAVSANGMVSSANAIASMAGVRALMDGGNAIDAAVAVASTLAVVEPFMSGPGGGGGYMLIHEGKTGKTHGLDYMGWAPKAADPSVWADQDDLYSDVRAACVPGILDGWLMALDRFGRFDRAQAFKTAIETAERGWPVSHFGAGMLVDQAQRLGRFKSSSAVFYPHGRPPRARELVKQPLLARSYREIVEGGRAAFYGGALGDRFCAAIQEAGGWLTPDDLRGFAASWATPIAADYRGRSVMTMPSPCSGIQYLESLKILEQDDLAALGHNSVGYTHLLIEAAKLASADRAAYTMRKDVDLSTLLSSGYAAARRTLVDPRRAAHSEGERFLASKAGLIAPGDPVRYKRDNTTHFEVADAEGNLVSVTQSNGAAWGCGFVAGDTGITVNNFLYWQDINPDSPNFLRPGAVMECPMAPCIVTQDGKPVLGIGTPGSYGILQTTLQMLINALDFGMNVQAAIEAPRFRVFEGTNVDVEARFGEAVIGGLRGLGHAPNVLSAWNWKVGGGHGIAIDPETRVFTGGADPRRDGAALGW